MSHGRLNSVAILQLNEVDRRINRRNTIWVAILRPPMLCAVGGGGKV